MQIEMLKNMATGRWREILLALAPALTEAIEHEGRHVNCPMPFHGESGRGDFRMFRDYRETGAAICTCGAYSDGLSLLASMNGWSVKEALEQVACYLTGLCPQVPHRITRPASQAAPHGDHAEEDKKAFARIREVWQAGIPLTDPRAKVAWWYLESRRLTPKLVMDFPALRLHPELPFYDEEGEYQGHFPALIACFCTPDGKPVSVHRTYLTPTGAKLPVSNAKKMMRLPSCYNLTGGAIRLGRANESLDVAEGIETALSVHVATRRTVWSCYSSAGIASFVPPAGVKEVWIWADHDRPHTQKKAGKETEVRAGLHAARVLKARLWAEHILCRVMLPPVPIQDGTKSVDWNDVLVMQGTLGFPASKRFMVLDPTGPRPVATATGGKHDAH